MTRPLHRDAFAALGTTAVVVVQDRSHLAEAVAATREVVAAFDRACSRFRADSELMGLRASDGRPTEVGPVLAEAVEVALRAAVVTGGDVDPTVGRAMRMLGYDRDFASVGPDGPPVAVVRVAPRWREVAVDRAAGTVTVPAGVELDLGATAKALAADHAARAAADTVGGGVLVSLGGDISLAGEPPEAGWPVLVGDRHDAPLDGPGPTVALRAGGLATSGTTARRWRRGGAEVHHIVDPATGQPAPEVWRTVTVAAASCVDANIASTASVIRGAGAVPWLEGLGLAARLVGPEGREVSVGGWGGRAEAQPVGALG